jgi:hypothetical protein
MIRCIVYLLWIFKMFHGLTNNPVYIDIHIYACSSSLCLLLWGFAFMQLSPASCCFVPYWCKYSPQSQVQKYLSYIKHSHQHSIIISYLLLGYRFRWHNHHHQLFLQQIRMFLIIYWGAGIAPYTDGLWAGRSEFDSRKRQEISLYSTASSPALHPTQPPVQWVPGALSLGLNWPGSEADQHTYMYCRGQGWWSCNFTPLYVFMAWWLIN